MLCCRAPQPPVPQIEPRIALAVRELAVLVAHSPRLLDLQAVPPHRDSIHSFVTVADPDFGKPIKTLNETMGGDRFVSSIRYSPGLE